MKSRLSERDICTKHITPAVIKAGWNEVPHHFREEVFFSAGRIKVRGKLVSRGKGKSADYILYYKPNLPIALIEAKDNIHFIDKMLFPLALPAEQKRIVTKVDQLMKLCDELESKLQQSQKDSEMLMQTVLQEAVG
jgi:16S rRNA U516 pseudouridylate synthase RsuA-like enzyme